MERFAAIGADCPFDSERFSLVSGVFSVDSRLHEARVTCNVCCLNTWFGAAGGGERDREVERRLLPGSD